MNVTFITGNQNKANLFAEYMGGNIKHLKLDLDEIQSLDLDEIVEHKVKQAYQLVESPVLVEDVGLTLNALGKLPGPFVKWFEKSLGLEGICKLVDNLSSREATASICYGFYDGDSLKLFKSQVKGSISPAVQPKEDGFGWNPIFIPEGSTKTYTEMSEDELKHKGFRETTVYPQLKKFLESLA